MKAFTDLKQSNKLAEFLPIESADMCFNISVRKNMPPLMIPYSRFDEFFNISPTPDFLIPCWSLAALIKMLPKGFLLMDAQDEADLYSVWVPGFNEPHIWKDNPLDACVEMIIKLHELNLL